MHTILYARVSTADQAIGHQRTQAEAAGFKLDEVIHDEATSGVSTLFRERKGGARLLDKVRRGDVVVVRWVDRLGRNYEDVTDTIRTLMQRGVIIKTVINGMTFDGATKDPIGKAVRDALIGFMAATAEAQAEATREAQRAGIAAVKASTDGNLKYRGRKPSYGAEALCLVADRLAQGDSPSVIARETGVSRATVYRIKEDPARAAAAVNLWGAA